MTSPALRTAVAAAALALLLAPVAAWHVLAAAPDSIGREGHDRGAIPLPATHVVRVRTGAAAGIAVWLGAGETGFARSCLATVAAVDGVFDLGALPAGRYQLLPFQVDAGRVDSGRVADPIASPATIEVGTDGRVTPDVVWPDGVR